MACTRLSSIMSVDLDSAISNRRRKARSKLGLSVGKTAVRMPRMQ